MRERSTSKPEAGLLRVRPHVVEFVRFRIDAPDRADAGSNVVAEQLLDQIGEALVPGGENDEIEGPAGAALQPDAIRLEGIDILILDQSHFAGDQKIRAADDERIAPAAGEEVRRPAGAIRIGSELEAHAPHALERSGVLEGRAREKR